MTSKSEPKPLAAQSFEAWWDDKRRLGFIPSPSNAAIAAWSHQQAKIDELEKKLALAITALDVAEMSGGFTVSSVAKAALEDIAEIGETTSYPACQTIAKPPTPEAP